MDISSEVAELPWRRREQMGERKSLGQSEWVRKAPIGSDAIYMSLWQCTIIIPIRSPQTAVHCAATQLGFRQ